MFLIFIFVSAVTAAVVFVFGTVAIFAFRLVRFAFRTLFFGARTRRRMTPCRW